AAFGCENSAGSADAGDDDIGLFGCHGSSPPHGSLRLQADDGYARERLLARHVLRREHRLRAGETDQPPAGEVLVAAVDRVGKHAFHGVGPQRVEERLLSRPSETRSLALLERRNHLILPCAIKARKWRLVGLAALGI